MLHEFINCSIVKLENLYLHLIFLFVCKHYRYDDIISRGNPRRKGFYRATSCRQDTSEEFARDSDVFVTLLTRN